MTLRNVRKTMNEKTLKTHEPANSQKPYHTVKTGFVNNPRTNS